MHDFLTVILVLLPIVTLMIGLMAFNMKAHTSSILSFAVGLVIALTYFQVPIVKAMNASLLGAMNGLSLLWIIFPVLFLYNIMKKSGSLESIRDMVFAMTKDRYLQIMMLAFGFVMFINGISGFGSAAAVAATLLIPLGISPAIAGTLTLLGVTSGTMSGSVGVPVLTAAKASGYQVGVLSQAFAWEMPLLALITPLMLALFIGGLKEMKRNFSRALIIGFGGAFGMWLAFYMGWAELVDILSGIFAMVTIALVSKFSKTVPSEGSMAELEAATTSSGIIQPKNALDFKALSPYLLLFVIITATRSIPAIGNWMKSFQIKWQIAEKLVWKFQYIYEPGLVVILSGLFAAYIYGIASKEVGSLTKNALKQSVAPGLSMVAVLALATMLDKTGISIQLAKITAAGLGKGYILMLPAIAALFTFASGSATNSVALLAAFHLTLGKIIGVDPLLLISLTAFGAITFNNICPAKTVVVISALGGSGQEGAIMRKTLGYSTFMLVFVTIYALIRVFVIGG